MITVAILLAILTDRSGSASNIDSSIFHDEVEVTIFNQSSVSMSVEGVSYPSLRRQDYPKLCDIDIYSRLGNPLKDCHAPLPKFEECTVVYYEEENCSTSIIQLAEQVKEQGGRAVIYRTEDTVDHLRRLDTANVTLPVILVEDNDLEIRRFGNEYGSQVNITKTVSDNRDNDEESSTGLYVLLSVFVVLLLVGVVVASLVIFMCYRRRHHHRTRQAVS